MDQNEKEWAKGLAADLAVSLSKHAKAGGSIAVTDSKKLPYKCEIHEYKSDGDAKPDLSSYETDLLISDQQNDGSWVPRVVVECKLKINTHDALTYSAKAATHKNVHPYLRYGILVGNHASQALPGRLIKHGAYFDFMLSWKARVADDKERQHFYELLGDEIEASRLLQETFNTTRKPSRMRYHSLHRKLVLKAVPKTAP